MLITMKDLHKVWSVLIRCAAESIFEARLLNFAVIELELIVVYHVTKLKADMDVNCDFTGLWRPTTGKR